MNAGTSTKRHTKHVKQTQQQEDPAMDDPLEQSEVVLSPEDQIKGLTPEQLEEVVVKVTTASDPKLVKPTSHFDYSEGTYRVDTAIDHMAVHFQMDGWLDYPEESWIANEEHQSSLKDGHTGQLVRNAFNYANRSAQTYNNALRDRVVETKPPPSKSYSASVSSWDIYNTYVQKVVKDMENKALIEVNPLELDGLKEMSNEEILESVELKDVLKTAEWMVNQNADYTPEHAVGSDRDAAQEDDAELRDLTNLITFQPLWKFRRRESKRLPAVTSMVWNPRYPDILAVGYGSYDFTKQGTGMICCFTLKNCSHPEYYFTTETGVMCLDFHDQQSALLVAGLYDGTVAVYDVRINSNDPIHAATDPRAKHTDPVWQVKWQKEEPGKSFNFFSVSSDGRFTNWIMSKNELLHEDLLELQLPVAAGAELDENPPIHPQIGLAGGCAFDFNPQQEHTFVVATEEGGIESYSKAYSAQRLRVFQGHDTAVYRVLWNSWHDKMFISCSADWTVKLWRSDRSEPLLVVDLQTPVADVAWAPFSSTAFAAITTDGRLLIYDVNISQSEPVGSVQLKQKAPLTRVCFNRRNPSMICVGDEKGVVHILKTQLKSGLTPGSAVQEIAKFESLNQL